MHRELALSFVFFYCLSIFFLSLFPISAISVYHYYFYVIIIFIFLRFCERGSSANLGLIIPGALPELGHLDPDASAGGTWDLRKIENTTLQENSFTVRNNLINF